MSRTDILEQIKTAELDAKAKVEKAEADKRSKIADARRMSVEKIQDAEAQANSNFESQMAAARDELASQRDALLNTGKKEADDLEAKAAAKIDEVKKFLNEELVTKNSILYVGPSRTGYTLIYIK